MRGLDFEPIERVRPKCDEVRQIPDRRKFGLAEEFHRHAALEFREIDFRALNKARQIRHREDDFVLQAPDKNQNAPVLGKKKLRRAAVECVKPFAQHDEPLHPPQL